MPQRTRRGLVLFVACFVLSVGLDQGTKAWARTLPVHPEGCTLERLAEQRCVGVPQQVIAGYWDWELAMNDGAAFSNFRGSTLVLTLIGLGALIMIGFMAARATPDQQAKRIALALIAGGALGNLIDRMRFGAVVDFVRWRIHDHHWPIFNIADLLLIAGVLVLLFEGVWTRRAGPSRSGAATV